MMELRKSLIAERLGVLPNFFCTAAPAPGLIDRLWDFARPSTAGGEFLDSLGDSNRCGGDRVDLSWLPRPGSAVMLRGQRRYRAQSAGPHTVASLLKG
jgi:hypothetical protein